MSNSLAGDIVTSAWAVWNNSLVLFANGLSSKFSCTIILTEHGLCIICLCAN